MYNDYRRVSREIRVGGVIIGGTSPISIQSMTNTDTHDIRHNRCGVGVTKDDFVALFLKSKARLRSRVVKLCRLTDNDRTRADHKDLFNIGSLRHSSLPP